MPFERGHEKMGGRRKGVPNRVTQEVREIARAIVTDPQYLAGLRKRVCAGEAPNMEPILWHYAHGRPRPQEEKSQSSFDGFEELLKEIWEERKGQVPRRMLREAAARNHRDEGAAESP